MKKSFFYAGLLAAGLMTVSTSCSKDEEIMGNGGNEVPAGEQVIVLDMQDTDVLSTKSRPLYSTTNQGAEKVTHVKLFIFELTGDNETGPMKLVNTIDVPNWNSASTDYNYGRKYTYKLTGSDKLDKDKKYTIVAIGQDEVSAKPVPFQFDGSLLPDFTPTKDTWNASTTPGTGFVVTDPVDYSSWSAHGDYKNIVGEIFSGTSAPVEIKYDGGFTADVLLKRQVAGVLGYYNRIPAWVTIGDKQVSTAAIRLVAASRNTQIDLTTSLAKQTDDTTGASNVEYIVNGFSNGENLADATFKSGKKAYIVYQIDLTKWFKGGGNVTPGKRFWSDASLDKDASDASPLLSEKVWSNALKGTNNSPVVADGSVLAGEFVIPIKKVSDIEDNTFELQLVDSTGLVTKAWDVKLDPASLSTEMGDEAYMYNVYRNHLYQIGKRGGGDDPNNPGTDPDKPQPLDKDQELTIKINDQWEFIHDMEIE